MFKNLNLFFHDIYGSRDIRKIWFLYIFALLLVAIFVTCVYIISEINSANKTGNAELVNISGQQRFIIQKVTFLASKLDHNIDGASSIEKDLKELKRMRDLFVANHQALLNGDEENDISDKTHEVAYNIYFEAPYFLDQQVQTYITNVDSVLDPSITSEARMDALNTINRMNSDTFFEALDKVVSAIEEYDTQQTESWIMWERLSYIFAILLLILEARFIFWPIYQYIKRGAVERDALLESKVFQDLVLENIPDFVFVKDKEFRIVQANEAFVGLYPEEMRDQIIGYTTVEKYNAEEAAEFLKNDRIAFEDGISEVEERIMFPDGQERTLLTTKTRFHDDDGVPYILGVARDITEILDVKNQLLEEQYTKEAFADAASDGYWDWLIQEDYEYMSPTFWHMFGFDPSEKEHHPKEWQDIIFEEDLQIALDNFERHVKTLGEDPFEQQVRYRHKDGSTVHVICKGKVVTWGDDGTPIRMIGTHTDITPLKRAKEKLEEANMALKRSNEELDEFAYIASHDLKEPLRGLHNYATFVLEDYEDKIEEDGKHKLQTIMRLSQRMEALIDNLLYYSRLGRVDLAIQNTNMNQVVENVLGMLEIQIKENNVRVDVGLLPDIKCDTARIEEVFRNLIMNAIKYNDSGLKKIEIGCLMDKAAYEDQCVFFIKDNGIGIQPEHHEKIFGIFKRLHGRDKYGGGTGSGLTLVKKIVERHNGDIWLESDGESGTSFFFKLQSNEA